jgi:hypothetical protein
MLSPPCFGAAYFMVRPQFYWIPGLFSSVARCFVGWRAVDAMKLRCPGTLEKMIVLHSIY